MFHSIPIFYNEKVCEVRIGAVRRYYRLHGRLKPLSLALFGTLLNRLASNGASPLSPTHCISPGRPQGLAGVGFYAFLCAADSDASNRVGAGEEGGGVGTLWAP